MWNLSSYQQKRHRRAAHTCPEMGPLQRRISRQ